MQSTIGGFRQLPRRLMRIAANAMAIAGFAAVRASGPARAKHLVRQTR
jgi:hypothetical protein